MTLSCVLILILTFINLTKTSLASSAYEQEIVGQKRPWSPDVEVIETPLPSTLTITPTDILPTELWYKIASYLDYNTKLHHVDRYFFQLITHFPLADMALTGFRLPPTITQRSQSPLLGMTLDFSKMSHPARMPTYIWYSFVDMLFYPPALCWPHMANTRITCLGVKCFNDHTLIELGQNLQRTPVHTLIVDVKALSDEGITTFIQTLAQTQVHTLYLTTRYRSALGLRTLGLSLSKTIMTKLCLLDNEIGDSDVYNLVWALQGSPVQTLDLSYNRLTGENASALGQALQHTALHTLNLSNNYVIDEYAQDLDKALQQTKIRKVNLRYNMISLLIQQQLQRQSPHIIYKF